MPEVPQYNGPQVKQEALPGVRVSADAPLSAFGGGDSVDRLESATKGMAGAVSQIAQEEKQKADQVAFMSADKNLSDLETNIQIQSSKMLGKDAAAAPDMAKAQWEKGIQDVTKGLSNDAQKMAVARAANQRFESLNKNIQLHVAGQLKSYDEQETQSYIDTSRNAAALNASDDQRIGQEIQRQKAAVNDWAQRNGVPQDSETFKNKLTDVESATHKEVIGARIDSGLVSQAREYLDANKDNMKGTDFVAAQKLVDEHETIGQAMGMYDQVKNMKLADGQPNETKMRTAVFSNPDLTDQKKEKVWEYVKARANEDLLNKNRRDADNERTFVNQAIQARQQGTPLQDALNLVDKYGIDDYDKTVKSQAIQAIYAPPKESDEVTKYNLWQGIQDGSVAMKDIDDALNKNKLNQKDWAQLKEENYKVAVEGKSPEMKFTNDRIKELAESTFGSNKQKAAAYLNMVNTESIKMSPEQKYKKAQDLLQIDPNTKHSFLGFKWGGQKQYESDLQTHDAQNLAFGKAKEDLGSDTVKAIGQGVLSNKDKFTPGDIDSFAVSLGGYDKIKPGTPNHDAIQWLMKKNMPVVPENVKAVVQRRQVGQK